MKDYLRLKKILTSILAIIILLSPFMSNDVHADSELFESNNNYYVTTSPVIFNYKNLRFKNDKLVTNGYMAVAVTGCSPRLRQMPESFRYPAQGIIRDI